MGTSDRKGKVALIAGAGPAGLTAALELLRRSDIRPLVYELDTQVGGISKTVNYRGNRMDLGGHRFFSKSDWVMQWWQQILPVWQSEISTVPLRVSYQNATHEFKPTSPSMDPGDAVMLVRQRLSRIFYRRRFFDYPLKLNATTIRNMGLLETVRIGMSYSQAQVNRRTPELTLEDFLVNRFGTRLYRTFFKDYTEKVWGVPCHEISADWGAQRIKGLSVRKALAHAIMSPLRSVGDTAQKNVETSLIERFLYPKLGPGQMWEEVTRQVKSRGGVVSVRHRVIGLKRDGMRIIGARILDEDNASVSEVPCDFFISTMPVKELTAMLEPDDRRVIQVASQLPYRDFMTVGLLMKRMRGNSNGDASISIPPDNWIYIQEPDVRIGRLQVFNNWSPALVANPKTVWLGLEYFCRQGDELWSKPDGEFIDFAAKELEKIGMISRADVLDGTVVRVPKAYPAYFGEYKDFGLVREYLESFSNLYPIGRNGMHRYNNQDHSMLAANAAVNSILADGQGKADIWDINADGEYHEEIEKVA